jgi:hypothetical protein
VTRYEIEVTFFVEADSPGEAVQNLDDWIVASLTHDGPEGWEILEDAVVNERKA